MQQIVIVGSGFGALNSVRTLRKEGVEAPITVVSPRAELFYYPSLIWVPARLRSREDLSVPLEGFFRRHRVEHVQGRATGLDTETKTLRTDAGDIAYDHLIVASGGRYLKKLPGIEHVYIPCEGWDASAGIRDRLESMDGGRLAFGFAGNPKEPVAVRGGPVFEFLFGIDTLLRKQGRRKDFELTFFSPAATPGVRMGERAVRRLLDDMRRRGIRTHLGHKLKAFTADKVITEGGEVGSDLTVFMPGMTGPAWIADSGLPLSPGGFVQADRTARVPGAPGVYVVGDAGSFPGPDWMPKQAHMADLQAEAAARNLAAELRGEHAEHGFDVELICIVDTLTDGVMVFRNARRNVLLKGPAFHWSKRLFEWMYLRAYRRAA
jgi:sulfide:quinone oxidoreductase